MMSCTREGASESFTTLFRLSNVCLWYDQLKCIVICCHEKHWTMEDMYWAVDWTPYWGEPWREHMCMECILGNCATAKK